MWLELGQRLQCFARAGRHGSYVDTHGLQECAQSVTQDTWLLNEHHLHRAERAGIACRRARRFQHQARGGFAGGVRVGHAAKLRLRVTRMLYVVSLPGHSPHFEKRGKSLLSHRPRTALLSCRLCEGRDMWWKVMLAYLLAMPLVVGAVCRAGEALTESRRPGVTPLRRHD